MSDADSKRLTRTERRRQETHEALRTAVVDLLLREDQPRLTSRLVAEEADVAVGTFYNHFDSIEEAIDASLTPLTELILSSAQGALEPDDPTEGLGILIARFIDDLVTNPRQWVAARRAGFTVEPVQEGLMAQRFIELGVGVPDEPGAAFKAAKITGRVMTTLIDEFTAEDASPRLPEQAGRMIGAGLITDAEALERMVAALTAETERLSAEG